MHFPENAKLNIIHPLSEAILESLKIKILIN